MNRRVPNGTPDCLTIGIHDIIKLQDIEIGDLIMAYIVGTDRNQSRMITASLDDLIDKDNSVRAIDAYVNSLNLLELGFTEYNGTNRGTISISSFRFVETAHLRIFK